MLRLAAIEWKTIGIAGFLYGAWLGLTAFHDQIGLILVCPALALLVCLFGSLQHEVVHGHPTTNESVNALLVFPALAWMIPFFRYADLHRRHHATAHLTDPATDTESFYLPDCQWQRLSPWRQRILIFHNTLLGRMLIGPWLYFFAFWRNELVSLYRNEAGVRQAWGWHLLGLIPVLWWLVAVCAFPLWLYFVAAVVPGFSLTQLRSFAEHRAHPKNSARTALIPSNPLLSFLFLNNNFHAAHHEKPALPWYALPAYSRRHWQRLTAENENFVIPGYLRLARLYGIRTKEPVAMPEFQK